MRHVPDMLADVVKLLCPKDCDRAARWLAEPCERSQQSSFSGAIIPKNGIELSAGKLRSYATQRRKTAKLFDQICNRDDGRGGGFSQRSLWN